MSGYHYSREPGAEGQIVTGEGAAPGTGLDALLDRERPPLRAAMEIGSAIADLLCIAAEDKVVHGDIRPAHIKVNERGIVSVEGYGVMRRATRAPEGRPDSLAVDTYGLGVVLHSMLSKDALGNLAHDADAHDDEVVSRVLAMDFSSVQGRRWLEDVRKFLCQILAFHPEDRPLPLDAANVLASVAGQCPGEGLEAWMARLHRPGAPRGGAAAPKAASEDLGGPVAVTGPFQGQKGGVRQAPAAKGQSTAFWSREKIAAMLADDDDADIEPEPPRRPMPVAAPPPAPPPVSAPPREPSAAPPKPASVKPATPPARNDPPPARNEAPRNDPPPRVEPPRRDPPPAAPPRIERSILDDPPDPPSGGTSKVVWIVVGAIVLALLCGGVVALSGTAWFALRSGSPDTTAVDAAQKAAAEAAEKARLDAEKAQKEAEAAAGGAVPTDGTGGADPKGGTDAAGTNAGATNATPPPTGGSAPSSAGQGAKTGASNGGSSSSGGSTGGSTGSGSTPKPAVPPSTPRTNGGTPATPRTPTPTPAPTPTRTAPEPAADSSTPYSVKFSAAGREGTLTCGDGQRVEFVSATTVNFLGTVTCLMRIGDGKGTVQVSRSTTVVCTEDHGKVLCTGG